MVKSYLDLVANSLHFIDRRHRRYALANLDIMFGKSKTLEEKNAIIKQTYKVLVYNLYEFIQNQTQDLAGYEAKITLQNDQVLKDAIANDRKIILVTAHFGNWEYGNTFIPLKYNKATTMVGKPMRNKYFNGELKDTRTSNDTEMLDRKNAGKGLVKALKQDKILGLVIDQHDSKGIDVEFFGKKCKMIESTSRLAIKFDAVLIPLFFRCDGFEKYTALFGDPIEPKDFKGENQVENLTYKQAQVMEDVIRQNPENWFLQHRRWKAYFPEVYK